MNDIVLMKCKSCGDTLTCVYDPGEPMTRNHPGEPAFWYSTNDETLVWTPGVYQHFDQTDAALCDHEGSYNKEDSDEFQVMCGVIANESFEYTRSDWY